MYSKITKTAVAMSGMIFLLIHVFDIVFGQSFWEVFSELGVTTGAHVSQWFRECWLVVISVIFELPYTDKGFIFGKTEKIGNFKNFSKNNIFEVNPT